MGRPRGGRMRFFLFILVNAVLFVRPAEIVPELEGAPIYEMVILVSLAASATGVLQQLTTQSLAGRPITVCVLGLLVAVVLSHLSHGMLSEAGTFGVLFLKIVLYYLLLVAVVDTPARMRQFLGWVGVLILALTALALLQHHGTIDLPMSASVEQRELNAETGEVQTYPR